MKYISFIFLLVCFESVWAQKTEKPPLHGKHWMAITGKPLGAESGAQIFQQGGNAVDAACAMLASMCTQWAVLSWGGETQAIIYNPKTKKVISIDALGFAPGAATAAYYKSKGYYFPPEYGPLAAVTPGTPGGLCYMLAEYGTMSLKQVLAPAMQMAAGYPIEAMAANNMQKNLSWIKQWPYSSKVFITHPGEKRESPEPGEIFIQKDLLATLTKMVEAEDQALRQKKSRKEAIYAAYDRFYKGDIAREFVRGCQEQGGLISMNDLARWKPMEEEPLHVNYKGVEVYKLQQWSQGPALLQCLNILENIDLRAMGYNSSKYIHTIYQTMNLAFADRDFYYGDPYFSPKEPIRGLLNKEYAKQRAGLIQYNYNDSSCAPGDPYPFEGKTNPYTALLKSRFGKTWPAGNGKALSAHRSSFSVERSAFNMKESLYQDRLWRGTTSIEACDEDGWVVSVTPSGGWLPACIAGNTGVGMSQRMQSFILDSTLNPFNVLEPYKKPRVTLTPTLAMKDGKPFLSFAVQGGDTQDQNLLQFFLNVVEFNMTVQQATEAANINTDQLWLSLGGDKKEDRMPRPGYILLNNKTDPAVRKDLQQMGYTMRFAERTSGPVNAIYYDWKHGSFWGGSSNYGEDYGIGW
ncbi:MAG TPA: gamma-glutamyltransferase [Puia sp.]|jgi:gamma-glutamyltranspeptidase/glutathione hydrolase|nr:gamma-glutamyltransferase [Puia sp.]